MSYEAKCISILTAVKSEDVVEGSGVVEKSLHVMAKFHYTNLKGEEVVDFCDLGTYLKMTVNLATAKMETVEQVATLEEINAGIDAKIKERLDVIRSQDVTQSKYDVYKRKLKEFEFSYPDEQGSGRYMDSIQVTTLDGSGSGGAYLEYIN